jgi:uncharacterized protein YndB with AHSA1/START domain
MAILNNSTVEVKRFFNASAKRVYDAIAQGILFETCGAKPESIKMDLREGGEWSVVFGSDYPLSGKFLKMVKNEKLMFTWGIDGQVTITLKEKNGVTEMNLLHEGITTEAHAKDIDSGWREGINDFSPHVGRTVVVERDFKQPIEKVYAVFAQPAFFSHVGVDMKTGRLDFRIGGEYYYDLPQSCSGKENDYVSGEFTDIVPNHRIAFTWKTLTANGPIGETLVAIDFKKKDDTTTHVRLTHSGFPDEATAQSHQGGWSDIFEKLQP